MLVLIYSCLFFFTFLFYSLCFFFFFFNDTATTEIYTLSLHDALPICLGGESQDHRLSPIDRDAHRRAHARPHVPTLLALQEPDDLPRDRAVVHRARQTGVPRARARGDQARRAVDPAVGRGADLQHGGAPARVGHLTAEGLGGADRRVLLRGVWHAAPRGADRRPRRADLPRRPRRRRVVRAGGPRASSPRHALRQVRRRPVREGDRHPRRLVRLGVQPRGRPRDAARAPVAGGDVHRGLGPAPRVVPVLAPRVGRHARRATL